MEFDDLVLLLSTDNLEEVRHLTFLDLFLHPSNEDNDIPYLPYIIALTSK